MKTQSLIDIYAMLLPYFFLTCGFYLITKGIKLPTLLEIREAWGRVEFNFKFEEEEKKEIYDDIIPIQPDETEKEEKTEANDERRYVRKGEVVEWF